MRKTALATAIALILTACGGGTGGTGNGGNNSNPPGGNHYLRVSMNGGAPVDFFNGAGADLLGDLGAPHKLEFGGFPAGAKNGFPAFSLYIWGRDKKIEGGQTYLPNEANIGATYNLNGLDRYESVHMDEEDFTLRIDTLTATETKGSF